MNTTKTKVLCYNGGLSADEPVISFGVETLRVVGNVKYLGSYMSGDCELDVYVESRETQASIPLVAYVIESSTTTTLLLVPRSESTMPFTCP